MTAAIDTKKLKSQQILLSRFMNGKLKDENAQSLTSRVFHHRDVADTKTQDQKILVSESPNMTYVGQNFGRRHFNTNRTTKSYVGIYDESTGKMRVCDAQLFNMMPYIPGTDEEVNGTEMRPVPKPQNYAEKMEMLTEAFGSKWKKSALEKSQRNRVDEETLKDHLAAAIDHGKEQAKSRLQNPEEVTTGFEVIPPCNKTADSVEDVYKLSDILTEADMDALQLPATEFFESTPEKVKEWRDNKMYPAYIISHLSCMPLDAELRWKRCECLLYLHYMIHLYKLTAKELKEKDILPKGCPALIKTKLRNNFTKDAFRIRCMPSRLKDKLVAYMITLCLLVDEFTLDLTELMQDLKLERNKFFLVLKSLGCKINKKVKDDVEKYVARLKLPLEFPQKPLFKQGRSKKR